MLPLLELLKHHVLTQLQKERLLKVTQDPAEGDSREVKSPVRNSCEQLMELILGKKCYLNTEINLPNIFEHVQHLGWEMGGGHIKLCKVSF